MSKEQVEAEEIEENAEPETEESIEDVVEKKSSASILPVIVVISLVLAISAAVAAGFSWYKNEQRQLVQSQTEQILNSKIQLLQEDQKASKQNSEAKQTSLIKQQQEISKQLTQITEKLGRNRHDWAVSEIRYTLRQANMRLQLFNDKKTAIVALKLADTQLSNLADPSLYKIRSELNKEITALQAIKEIDIDGVSLKLSALAGQINELEETITQRSKKIETANIPSVNSMSQLADWKKHIKSIWSELKTLVTIRRTDKKILPLLSKQESQQLRQALGLKIEIARLALLQKNTKLFRSSLQSAINSLNEHFNADQPAVVSITDELKALMALQLVPNYPDISGSLTMLERAQQSEANNKSVTPVKPKQIESPTSDAKQTKQGATDKKLTEVIETIKSELPTSKQKQQTDTAAEITEPVEPIQADVPTNKEKQAQ